jgi:hypothetical protein
MAPSLRIFSFMSAEQYHPAVEIAKIAEETWRGLTPAYIASKVIGGALLRQILHEGRSVPSEPTMLTQLAQLLRVTPAYLQDLERVYRKQGGTSKPATREFIRPEGQLIKERRGRARHKGIPIS